VLDARKRRVVRELNAADRQVVAAEHRRTVAVVLDLDLRGILDLDLVAGEVQETQQVVVVEEDVGQTADEVLLTSKTC